MIKFINLDNGYTYMGEQPYIHWFPGQQSTNIIYTMPLCFMSECEDVYAYMNQEVFHLLNIQQDKPNENIKLNDVSYADLNDLVFFPSDEEPSMKLQGVPYIAGDKTYYIYLLYIMAQSDSGYECIDSLQIIENYEEPVYNIYKIGADFYEENENLNTLLSNFGVNIPTSIQKCFLDSNVHEEKPDNIIINRKFKELLSNYWDIIANKGSYKSLINSLKWFEWGEDLKIRDVWAKADFDRIRYEEKPLIKLLTDKYKSTINGFAKTTFVALNYALRKVAGNDYENYNPVLEDAVSNWSKQDLMLKLSLLHRFYETYFLPVHEQIFHASVDDIVFSDVINIFNGNSNHREDHIYDVKDFDIIVNNNEPIYVSNVSAGVDKDTLFCNPYIGETDYDYSYGEFDEDEYERKIISTKHTIVGVKPINEVNEVNIKDFYLQNYNGLGAIVPISCKMDLGSTYDFIHSESISIDMGPDTVSYGHDEPDYKWDECSITVHDNKIFKPTLQDGHYIVDIDFNVLCKTHSLEEVACQLRFKSAGGQLFVKTITFEVLSDANVNLHLYRVNHVNNVESLYEDGKIPKIPTNYILKNIKNKEIETELESPSGEESSMLYKMYLPSRNIGEIKYISNEVPFIKAFGWDDDNQEISQTDQFDFKFDDNGNYSIEDKRYNKNNEDFSYLVKLFIPLNSEEYLKNKEYNISYSITGEDIPSQVDAQCYICDIHDFNIYSDKKSIGYLLGDTNEIIPEKLMINKNVTENVYLCISFSSYALWKKIEINNLKISCPDMGGVAFNNLLIIKNWELDDILPNDIIKKYLISEKTPISQFAGNTNPEVVFKTYEVEQYIDRNNIYFENPKLIESKVHVKYGPFGICNSINMDLIGSDFNDDNVLKVNYIIHYGDGSYYKDQWVQKDKINCKKNIKHRDELGRNIKSIEIVVEEDSWQYFGIENVNFDIKKIDNIATISKEVKSNYVLNLSGNDNYSSNLQDGQIELPSGQKLYIDLFSGLSLDVVEGKLGYNNVKIDIDNKFPANTQKITFNMDVNDDGNTEAYHILINDEIYKSYSALMLNSNPIINVDLSNYTLPETKKYYSLSILITTVNAESPLSYIGIHGMKYYMPKSYSICVSKEFWYDPAELLSKIPQKSIYRNDMVFFPEHHKLVPFGKTKTIDEEGNAKYIISEQEEDYMLRNNDVLAVIPEIFCNGETVDFKWNNKLNHEKTTWEFENLVTGKIYKYNYIQQPYILGDDGELEKGYYSITFNYKLTDIEREHQIKTGSAFIKK